MNYVTLQAYAHAPFKAERTNKVISVACEKSDVADSPLYHCNRKFELVGCQIYKESHFGLRISLN